VLTAIALIPSAPVLVPELASGAAGELDELRAAVLAAARELPQRWIAIGVGPIEEFFGSDGVGTFAGYGADVRVGLWPASSGVTIRLPLCALITGWVRGQVNQAVRAEVRAYPTELTAAEALARGRAVRTELDKTAEPIGVLLVADGANTLTASAPGGHDPASVPVQAALDDALASGDARRLRTLPDAVLGRVAYQVLAGLVGPGPSAARELYRGAPYGVGYFVGGWTP
jgi:hypothetical protein